MAQRQKMQLVNDFLGPLKDVLRIGFEKEAQGRLAYAAAKSYNFLHGVGGEFTEQYLDYSKALVSIGNVSLPSEASVERMEEGLLFRWKYDEIGFRSDTLMVIVNYRGQYLTSFKLNAADRQEESYLWKTCGKSKGKYDAWIVFRDYKERGFSNSMWLGLV